MRNATFVREMPEWKSTAQLYELSEPFTVRPSAEDSYVTTHIVISSCEPFLRWEAETLVFPVRSIDEDGTVHEDDDLRELAAVRGKQDAPEALERFLAMWRNRL